MKDTAAHNSEPETPLAAQWGVTPSTRVWVGGRHVVARREIEKHIVGARRLPSGSIDVAFIAPQSIDEARYFVNKLRSRLAPDGTIWVIEPEPTASMPSGSAGPAERLADALVDAGWVVHDIVGRVAIYRLLRFTLE